MGTDLSSVEQGRTRALDLLDDPEQRKAPEGFLHLVRQSIQLGREQIARDPNHIPLGLEDLDKGTLDKLAQLGLPSSLAHAQTCFAGFFYGMSEALWNIKEREKRWVHGLALAGSAASNELAKALLWLDDAPRQVLVENPGNNLRVRRDKWIYSCSGSAAVAWTIYELLGLTKEVYFPTVREDTEDKIDLLAYFPKEGRGLCLQIKSNGGHPRSGYQRLKQGKNGNDAYLSQVLEGSQRFDTITFGDWHGILLRVGLQGAEYRLPSGSYGIGATVIRMVNEVIHDKPRAQRRAHRAS